MRCLKTSIASLCFSNIFYYECNGVISYHLDSLVILALLRASRLSSSELSSHLNKEICVCNRGGCAVPLTLALSHNGTYNIPLQAKYINAWVVSVSQSPYHSSLKLALSFNAPDPTATTSVGRLQGGSSNPDQTMSYKF